MGYPASVTVSSESSSAPRIAVATEVDLAQPYGHVVHLTEMFSCLAELGLSITVFVPQLTSRPIKGCFHDSVDVVPIPVPYIPKVRMILYELRLAYEIIRRNGERSWNLIYTRSDLYSFGGWLASVLLSKPHVIELNGLKGDLVRYSGQPPLLARTVEALEGWLARQSKRVVVVTKELLRRVCEVHGVQKERCAVVENGVNTEHFRPAADPLPPSPFRIVFAGQLTRNQGIPTLLRAASLMREGSHITIIGDGPEMDALRRRHDELGLGEKVSFRGAVPYEDLPGELVRHHAAVAPYAAGPNAKIGYSAIKIFSYLSCGLPVVASRLPGGELVDENGVGVTVPPDNPAALAEALEVLREGVEGRRDMARRARELAVSRLDWEGRARELRDAIEDLLYAGQTST